MDISQVFPQDVLVAVTLVGHKAEDGGARDVAGYVVGLPFCSVAITALQVAGVEALRVGLDLALFPLSVCFPLS